MTKGELGLLGLGHRAGSVAVGTGAVRAALQRNAVWLVVVASDRSERTEEKVMRLARAKGIRTVVGPRAATLGERFGRPSLQAVGVRDRALAAGIATGT